MLSHLVQALIITIVLLVCTFILAKAVDSSFEYELNAGSILSLLLVFVLVFCASYVGIG